MSVSQITDKYRCDILFDDLDIDPEIGQSFGEIIRNGTTANDQSISDLMCLQSYFLKEKGSILRSCEELSDMLPEAMIICGDGTDRSLLLEEGLATAESFVTLTNMESEVIYLG